MALNEQQKAFVTGTIKPLIEAHKQQLGDKDAVKRHAVLPEEFVRNAVSITHSFVPAGRRRGFYNPRYIYLKLL